MNKRTMTASTLAIVLVAHPLADAGAAVYADRPFGGWQAQKIESIQFRAEGGITALPTGAEPRARTPIPVGAEDLDGVERRLGGGHRDGAANPIGTVAPGCVGRITAPSLPGWRWERLSPSLLWAMSLPGLRRTCAGIGRIPTATVVTGTIVSN